MCFGSPVRSPDETRWVRQSTSRCFFSHTLRAQVTCQVAFVNKLGLFSVQALSILNFVFEFDFKFRNPLPNRLNSIWNFFEFVANRIATIESSSEKCCSMANSGDFPFAFSLKFRLWTLFLKLKFEFLEFIRLRIHFWRFLHLNFGTGPLLQDQFMYIANVTKIGPIYPPSIVKLSE